MLVTKTKNLLIVVKLLSNNQQLKIEKSLFKRLFFFINNIKILSNPLIIHYSFTKAKGVL